MKKNIKIYSNGQYVNKEINYIPSRFIFAMTITILEILSIIGIMVILALYVPYFYLAILITEIVFIIAIVVSNDNPDYKIGWLFFVIILPLVGLMLYFIFHKRILPKKIIKRLKRFKDSYKYQDYNNFNELKNIDDLIVTQANCLCDIANVHLYKNSKIEYFKLGETMYDSMLNELKKAKKFIFLEYFIIEEGIFWNSILEILKEKAKNGIEVKLVYDDIGCMGTLSGNYYKKMRRYNIETVPFSKLKGQADGEFNNRSHRKILVIDGRIAYTGGINIADEYINKNSRLGHWKDIGVKIEGKAVNELTKLFLTDYYINIKKIGKVDFEKYYIAEDLEKNDSFIIPFGDGPKPTYQYNVSKIAIINLLNQSRKYAYITTPYLIVDNELMKTLENTAKRGVDIRIIVPHIPDKKIIFGMTKSNYKLLIKAGVKIYEYTPGFIHSKLYIADDKFGIIGTINLDYRSLTHHFENGVWIYNDSSILEMKKDFINTMNKSKCMNDENLKETIFEQLINVFVKLFSPLL